MLLLLLVKRTTYKCPLPKCLSDFILINALTCDVKLSGFIESSPVPECSVLLITETLGLAIFLKQEQ